MTDKPPKQNDSSFSSKGLPEANEFSPGQIKLRELLAAVAAKKGDRDGIIELIREEFFSEAAQERKDPGERLVQQQTRAYNALLGASKYGLVDLEKLTLTDIGRMALKSPTDEHLYRLFASHIIRDLNGFDVLFAVREMQVSGLSVNKTTLQGYLEQQGFHLPRATTHHMKLLQWLRQTDILPVKGYEISVEAVEQISGLSLDAADAWSTLTADQKAFLRVLRKIALLAGSESVPAKEVVDATVLEYGQIFRRPDQLAATVFKPLADPAVGWIVHNPGKRGRGGKSGKVAATQKLLDAEVDLLPQGEGLGIPPDLKAKLKTSVEQIYVDLESSDTHCKGIALELLAVRMAIDLALIPTHLRERSTTTGGAEVDLVAEGTHLHFSRWLLQCKNTKMVHVSDVAKEAGMALLLKAHVIVMVTTGRFSSSVSTYANELTSSSQLQVILLDGKALSAYRRSGPTALRHLLGEAARETLAIKRPQVVGEAGS